MNKNKWWVQEQSAFFRDICELQGYADKKGYDVTTGEAERPMEMQEIYVRTGRSKTMNSQHRKRRAMDLHFYERSTGRYLATREEIEPFGDFWESLDPKNRWGGSWRGRVEAGKSKFVDAPHFERMD